jgi:hypothetical protein
MTNTETERLIELVKRQVGFKEQPKGSNRGIQVDQYTGGRAEPWCAHFVAWCFRSIGKPLPNDVVPTPKRANPLASVSFTERIFKELDWHYRNPQAGDIVFFATRGKSDRGPGRHIGIVIAVHADKIEVVDGNWGDAVNRRFIPLENSKPTITGFGRVP